MDDDGGLQWWQEQGQYEELSMEQEHEQDRSRLHQGEKGIQPRTQGKEQSGFPF